MKTYFLFILILLINIIHTEEPNYPDIFYKLYVKACFQYDANFETEIKNKFRRIQIDFTMDFLCVKPDEEKSKQKKYLDNSKLAPILKSILNADLTDIKEEEKTVKFRFINQRNIGEHIFYHVLGKKIPETNEKCLMIEQRNTVFSMKRKCTNAKKLELLVADERNILYGTNIYFSTIVNNLEKKFTLADINDETFK